MNDHQIAAALRASSPDALAELFAAYGDNLFRYCWSMLRNREIAQIALRDTLVAAQAHSANLADPESLGPWLYSLARAECRRHRAGPAARSDEAPVRTSQRDADSRLMAWNAVMGMTDDEFEALDLTCRHDVDVALVLGLSAGQARALLDGASQSLERALGAEILVSRAHACPDRAEVLTGWAGSMPAPVRERVLEHAAGCEVCGPKLPRNVSPARVFALLPAPALTPLARAEVLGSFPDHRPRRERRGPGAGVLIAAAAVIALVFVLGGSAGPPAAVRAVMPTVAAGLATGPAPERPSGLGSAGAVPSAARPGTGRAQPLRPRLSTLLRRASRSGRQVQVTIASAPRPLPPAKAPGPQKNAPPPPAAPGGGGTPTLEPPASAPQIVQVSWTARPGGPGHRRHPRPSPSAPAPAPTTASPPATGSPTAPASAPSSLGRTASARRGPRPRRAAGPQALSWNRDRPAPFAYRAGQARAPDQPRTGPALSGRSLRTGLQVPS